MPIEGKSMPTIDLTDAEHAAPVALIRRARRGHN
jgi:hypothetical protein